MPDSSSASVPWGDWVAFGMLTLFLLASAVIDWRTRKVPNRLTYPAVLTGLVWSVVNGALGASALGYTAWEGLQLSFIGLFCGLVPFEILRLMGGPGGGDAKVMAAVGAISARWELVLVTAFYGILANALLALFVMIRKGIVKRTMHRIFGALMLWSAKVQAEVEDPDEEEKIPYTFGFCIGGILAGVEILVGIQTPWAEFGPTG